MLLSHPQDIEALLVANSRHVRKHYLLRMNRLLLGDGLLVSEGDLWRRQRRLVQPAFQPERVEAYGEVMVAYAERMLSGWQDGEERDLHADMTRLTQQIVAKTLFGAEVTDEANAVGAALDVVMASFVARIDSPIHGRRWGRCAPPLRQLLARHTTRNSLAGTEHQRP